MVSRVAGLLVFEDGEEMFRRSVDQLELVQADIRAAAERAFLPVLARFRTRRNVLLHHIGPRPRGELGRSGGQVDLCHAFVQGRLLDGLILGGKQTGCLHTIGSAEALLS